MLPKRKKLRTFTLSLEESDYKEFAKIAKESERTRNELAVETIKALIRVHKKRNTTLIEDL